MRDDEAQRPREAADGCRHRGEGSQGAEGGSGKTVQIKERKAEKVCKFTGAEPGESLKIIQTWILEQMGLCRWWHPCVSS